MKLFTPSDWSSNIRRWMDDLVFYAQPLRQILDPILSGIAAHKNR
jgi:hypothetical protein